MENIFLKKNQKGQAIFEFIIFIPLLVFLYTIFYTAGNSLNGAINQQKAIRGYYYNLLKNNSYIISQNDLIQLKNRGMNKIGFFALGYKEHGQSESEQFASCFQFSSMLRGTSNEKCDDSSRTDEGSSTFIRIFLAYGVCSANYEIDNTGGFHTDQAHQTAYGCMNTNR